jgi:hypothetical protein
VLKRDPLVKIKVTGVYNENDQYYYRNPVTGCWQKILGEANRELLAENLASPLELFKKIACRLKKIADGFYEDSKELFGGSMGNINQNFQ